MTKRSFTKTVSWAVVSFFVIWGTEVVVAAAHGMASLAEFAWVAAAGTAISCVVKSPVYFVHDGLWDRVFLSREAGRLRPREHFVMADPPTDSEVVAARVDPLWAATSLGREAYAVPPAPCGCGSILCGAEA